MKDMTGITVEAFWVSEHKIKCSACGLIQNVDLKKKFEEAYATTIKMYESQIEHLKEQIKTYEEEEKSGRYVLMNDGDMICHTDEHSIIYEYAIECIKNGANPKELMVIDNDRDRDSHGSTYTILQFLWEWGY